YRRDGGNADTETDLSRVIAVGAGQLIHEIPELHLTRLEANRVDVGKVVSDDAQRLGIGIEPRESRRERSDCHEIPALSQADCVVSAVVLVGCVAPATAALVLLKNCAIDVTPLLIEVSCSSELKVASCETNSVFDSGLVGSWFCSCVTSN